MVTLHIFNGYLNHSNFYLAERRVLDRPYGMIHEYHPRGSRFYSPVGNHTPASVVDTRNFFRVVQ